MIIVEMIGGLIVLVTLFFFIAVGGCIIMPLAAKCVDWIKEKINV